MNDDGVHLEVPTLPTDDEPENPAENSEILVMEKEDSEDVLNITSSKRRKDTADSMEIDENEILSSQDKENISRCIKRFTRKELEDLILVKTVEAIIKHSEAGKLRMKVSDLQTQKDRMFQRVGHLQKQVVEMSRALKLLIDNYNRDPNNLNPNKKHPPPIKFSRSVGLQIAMDPPFRSDPTKVVHVNDEKPINGLIDFGGQNAMRRGAKGVENSKRVLQQGNNLSQLGRKANLQSPNLRMTHSGNVAVKSVTKQTGTKTGISSGKNNYLAKPTVVDLTDADDPNVMKADGIKFQIVNQLNSSNGNHPTKFISSNQTYPVFSQTAAQVRPLVVNQQQTNKNLPTTLLFRNVAPKHLNFTQTRPSVTERAGGAGSSPRVAATIGTGSGTMMRAPMHVATVQRKFQLPALPSPVSISIIPQGRLLKDLPTQPILTLNEQSDGIVLSWTMKLTPQHADIASYQIYALQESPPTSGKVTLWKKVGDVKALPLPMACTLSQFTQGNRYFFIVRAVDNNGRTGPFCEPSPIILQHKS